MRFEIRWRWYDLWVGAYINWPNRGLYICPLPTLCIGIGIPHLHDPVPGRGENLEGRYFCAICGKEVVDVFTTTGFKLIETDKRFVKVPDVVSKEAMVGKDES